MEKSFRVGMQLKGVAKGKTWAVTNCVRGLQLLTAIGRGNIVGAYRTAIFSIELDCYFSPSINQ
jgi:hypothetical protein